MSSTGRLDVDLADKAHVDNDVAGDCPAGDAITTGTDGGRQAASRAEANDGADVVGVERGDDEAVVGLELAVEGAGALGESVGQRG